MKDKDEKPPFPEGVDPDEIEDPTERFLAKMARIEPKGVLRYRPFDPSRYNQDEVTVIIPLGIKPQKRNKRKGKG